MPNCITEYNSVFQNFENYKNINITFINNIKLIIKIQTFLNWLTTIGYIIYNYLYIQVFSRSS